MTTRPELRDGSIAWVKRHLGNLVEPVPVEGDKPLLLDDPSCAYLTLSDHHQLFCVAYRDGRPEGRREHLAACAAGQLIFGLQPKAASGASALLLAGVSGSLVWRLPMAALLRLGQAAEGAPVLAELFDRWIELLIAALPPAAVPARSRALQPGGCCHAASGQPLRGAGGIVWIAPSTPPSIYRGIELGALGSSAEAWPLSEQAWLLCEPAEFRVWSTEQLLRASGQAEFALGFSAFVAQVATARRAHLARRRLQSDEAARRDELQQTAAVLSGLARIGTAADSGEPSLALGPAVSHPLSLACQRIFRRLGPGELEPPPVVPPPGHAGLGDMQRALDRIHGLRTRAILLEGDWQRGDAGPLLGFQLDSDGDETVHPVALLPRRGGYDVYDPREGTTRALDHRTALGLHPRAHQFYRSLPDRALSPLGVLAFAAHGVRPDLGRIVAIGLAAGLLGTALPLLTGQVYDRIIPGAERGLLWQLIAVLGAVFLGTFLFDFARGLLLVRAQTRMDAALEAGVWDRLLSLPLPFFRQFTAGDLAARAQGIGAMRDVLASVGLTSLLSGVFSTWNLALLFYYDVKLALAALGLAGVAGLVAAFAAYADLGSSRASAVLDGKLNGLSLQLLGGIGKLRSAAAENRAFAVWARSFAQRRELELRGGRVEVRVAVFQSLYPLLCSMLLYWLVVREQAEGLSTGAFLAFSVAFATFMSAMLELVGAALKTMRIVPLYELAAPILQHPGESRGAGEPPPALRGSIELSHVSFRYRPDAPLVLDDLTLSIEPGEFVAIVGPSGSGKSTLLRVLLGFDSPSEGGVYYDGQALAGLDVRALRQQIGVVLQHSQVMAGDIFSNIVGSSGRSIDEAWRAARLAAFDADIEAMPMGMHTVLAQGGGTLSGGQRQRLLIARALAAQPRILFFDEATSALDNRTQAAVRASLDGLRVTRVVIAHRLSTIQAADRILVLDRGRIVQSGRYDRLLAQAGLFAVLARRQLTGMGKLSTQ